MSDENISYLGDGAYVEITSHDSIRIFTSNGVVTENEIFLDGSSIRRLISLWGCKSKLKITLSVIKD